MAAMTALTTLTTLALVFAVRNSPGDIGHEIRSLFNLSLSQVRSKKMAVEATSLLRAHKSSLSKDAIYFILLGGREQAPVIVEASQYDRILRIVW